ncbi:glucosamine-6-phosphate deaminase [Flavisolibacter tropicus]|uniref:Glucosamine-6-phosphate deaminase n=1 Tax=Flavisolibacter tropicus TaxID=1492898 RepID=A0A172TWS2_9BACT|nr:glucosamine-6-phosphate deaminase [Flavisolibacter tropicus]ANE51480.1 glucosamine-6-phosphate deaminase [Flavisolibacter tropicus]
MTELTVDKLQVRVYNNREEMGNFSAKMAANKIRTLLEQQPFVNIIFAAAASQNEFLDALSKEPLEWSRINAFHMDEYIGLPDGHPQCFGTFLKHRIFDKVPFHQVHYLKGNVTDIQAECERYAALLEQNPVDITCMGIGENSHLAFNDPHVADFNDKSQVKVVDLDEACKQQQVNEGCFESVEQIPINALTLTIPALLKANYIFCMVPGPTKAKAVYHTLEDEITERHPSTILRTHPNAILFLDKESAACVQPVAVSY